MVEERSPIAGNAGFTRAQLDQLLDIKRRLKEETGERLQLASPRLYKDMEAFWHLTPSPITKSRIRAFLRAAGVEWDDPLADEASIYASQSTEKQR